jgi:hypothetical protein
MGWALLPVLRASKAPHYEVLQQVYGSRKWGPLGDRRASPPEIKTWLECDPHAGIGILTGSPSGNLVVVDIDCRPKGVTFPVTPTVETGRGLHLYLRSCSAVRTQEFRYGHVKGEGGYVVAPPSVHSSGDVYKWRIGPDHAELADIEVLRDLIAKPFENLSIQGTSYEVPLEAVGGPLQPVAAADFAEVVDGLARREDILVAVCPSLGIPNHRLGVAFRCVLPGHQERHPSASLHRDPETGVWLYRDWHCRGPEWLTLAEVRGALGYGRVNKLPSTEQARWYLRIASDAGLIKPVPVDLPELPSGAGDATAAAREGFALLLGLRWHAEPGEPAPFGREFAAAWCPDLVSEWHARKAIEELLRLGTIEKVDEHRKGLRSYNLYLPGRGRRR